MLNKPSTTVYKTYKPTTFPMENKLDPEFKKKWIAALRSGEYKQGTGWMYKYGKYCCLGVASELCGVPAKGKVIILDEGYTEEEISKIPQPLRGNSSDNNVVKYLTSLNDVQRESFFEIADYIEKNL